MLSLYYFQARYQHVIKMCVINCILIKIKKKKKKKKKDSFNKVFLNCIFDMSTKFRVITINSRANTPRNSYNITQCFFFRYKTYCF
jgi:hypothetical protein